MRKGFGPRDLDWKTILERIISNIVGGTIAAYIVYRYILR